jgi:hypothetical protein
LRFFRVERQLIKPKTTLKNRNIGYKELQKHI